MGRDLAIDLGTATILVYRQGDGVVFEEPSVVAVHAGTGRVEAMGEAAWARIGGDSGNVLAIRPLRHGAMTEFDMTQAMLEVVVRKSRAGPFPKPRVLVCVASMASEVEKRAIEEAVRFAGG
ncbi:MAG: rod shape-determining protein MreB, partial [Actinomycetota bacterium]|nr:rod shape-determining protein MreB [Actinomycetota bacterium]